MLLTDLFLETIAEASSCIICLDNSLLNVKNRLIKSKLKKVLTCVQFKFS